MQDPTFDRPRRLTAEFLGTAFLVAAVVGSGVMGERLAGGNEALALLANTLSTGAALIALILVFSRISGAHFNPAVSLALALRRQIAWKDVLPYTAAQVSGGVAGTMLAHLMFDLPVLGVSGHARTGTGQWTGEIVATFGLLVTIFGCSRSRPEAVPYAVGLFIMSAYWFTSSTSFANPAVTLARALTVTFSGIQPADVAPFMAAQLTGALLAVAFFEWLDKPKA